MKTTTGQDILNQAAENAQRTRDKIPLQEQVMLQGFIATEFQSLINSQAWPEMIPPVFNVTAANRQFSKNESSANPADPEMGDILWLGYQNPETCRYARPAAFSEGDDTVFVESNYTNLWVEYMLPYPGVLFPDMNPGNMTLAAFFAQTLPRRFRNILACRAAGHLLMSDPGGVNASAGGVQYGLAEKALANEINRLPPTPWWRATARFARPRERHHFGTGVCA